MTTGASPDSPDPLRFIVAPNGGSRPVPDPTELTDKAIAKAVAALTDRISSSKDIIDARLDGMEKAADLRLKTIDAIPGEIRRDVTSLELLQNEKFSSIQTQFKERDTRAERESRDNKVAVEAAFAAQKEAATKQDEANAKAIDKSEKATAETIKTNQELNRTETSAITKSLDELKQAVTRIESTKVGVNEQKTDQTASRVAIYATVGLIITVVLFVVTVIGLVVAAGRPV